ncbi:hypothetical protein BX616_000932 [Lobosporangium transversale]|uniref:F-box domain-containing protein n=1 Tax=Lobosporangium transversale TaxID=64571 RepID=A0A1Y2GZZ6_9FUNG|nr:hypothetical protein BCR41DRAFT_392645 [Lobosporangium transversale]KAF9905757.1 hypothetical protein BX616_000932 [Lobosporangium transversale]ORZ27321.1 hypothetical protein BCR41DRAFT_392645 [Lobosporangium transversale]|eukprot:XP_021885048.1 hypothetical protein BCR41DRAFT_392645 [Lobosporangium transversale]
MTLSLQSLSSSPLNLTEILQTILSLLDPPSLVAASQVSRHWYQCCSPILWSRIASSDWSLARFSPRQLYMHAHLVRDLEWRSSQNASTPYVITTNVSPPHQSLGDINMTTIQPVMIIRQQEQQQQEQQHQQQYIDPLLDPQSDSKICNNFIFLDHQSGRHRFLSKNVKLVDDNVVGDHQLSLACLSKIVARCINIQRLCLHAEWSGIYYGIMHAIHGLKFLQSLELYAHRVILNSEKISKSTANVVTKLLNVQELISKCPQLQRLVLRGAAFCFQSASTLSLCDNQENKSISGSCKGSTLNQSESVIKLAAISATNLKLEHHQYLPSHELLTPHSSHLWPSSPISLHDNTQTKFLIQRLSLDTAITESELTLLLSQCPSLQSLDLPGGLAWEMSDRFLKKLTNHCPHLIEFTINASCNAPVTEERLTALVLALAVTPRPSASLTSSSLRRFGARSCMFGDSTLEAIEKYCPDLEELDISLTRGSDLSKPRLQRYLRLATKLKKLEADAVWIPMQGLQSLQEHTNNINQHHFHESNSTISSAATTSFSLPSSSKDFSSLTAWGSSRTLEHLTIGFTSPDRNTHQCRAMYALLATLTELQHLQLSYTCLKLLTPGSGFQRLESLKKLRTFSIETCGYGVITREDLVWMVTAWPKLERIVMNSPGVTKERQYRTWLREINREDVAIESRQMLSY